MLNSRGEPVEGVRAALSSDRCTSFSRSDANGGIHFSGSQLDAGDESLLIAAQGYKPIFKEGPLKDRAEYYLEPLEYADLRVLVTDAAGNALPGAVVYPRAPDLRGPWLSEDQVRSPYRSAGATNAKGFVSFNDLAAGPRDVSALCKGYYLPAPVHVELAPNDPRELTLAMSTAYRIEGKLEAPPGTDYNAMMVQLDNWGASTVDATGAYAFDAVTPGIHTITVHAPALNAKSITVTVPGDAHTATNPVFAVAPIELIRKNAIAIDCGAEFAGCRATLDDESTHGGCVDGTGRIEFSGVSAGRHTLKLEQMLVPGGAAAGEIADLKAGPFDVPLRAPTANPGTLTAMKAPLKPGAGILKGVLKLVSPPEFAGYRNLNLRIESEHAAADAWIKDHFNILTAPEIRLQLMGAPPADFSTRHAGAFNIAGLPAGEYKVFATILRWDLELRELTEANPPKQSAAFRIKDGETLDLGEIRFQPDPAPSAPEPKPQNAVRKQAPYPPDKPEGFAP